MADVEHSHCATGKYPNDHKHKTGTSKRTTGRGCIQCTFRDDESLREMARKQAYALTDMITAADGTPRIT